MSKANFIFTKVERFFFRSKINFFATFYLNFRTLPFKSAIRLPIYVYGRIEFASLNGIVKIEVPKLKSGLIKIGIRYCRSQGVTRLFNDGLIVFHGNAMIHGGSEIHVASSAALTFGKDLRLYENTMIFCYEKIVIGNFASITYDANVFDTDFHYCIDVDNCSIERHTKPIIIGDYNWIGNKCTIKKGTITPDYTIVAASYSLLCRDYTKDTPIYPILGGVPAKVIGKGKRRIFNWDNQYLLDYYFANGQKDKFVLENMSIDEFCQLGDE